MYFPSKRDLWMTMVLWGIALTGVTIPAMNGEMIGFLIMLPLSLLLLWFWFRTGYKIEDEIITVSYGPIKMKVPINNIQIIKKRKNPFTAPALSTDKLELVSGRFDVLSVSPEDQEEFIKQILEINNKIKLDSRIKFRK
ncbi:PH domain-containing protein [Virgibacillus sp. NKC19-16]|uniref:PH domain-containing protein n=1 Tax=Virgibacillus salidurans TaxID=2831673 RepID=UPI001F43BBD1|nr:PH domain-containing protein [Virgibacillus sp. NKC19-16]UJL48045.1 PH domain-containing protein [Virgibacillus sp. NKC19-16]